MVKCNRGQVERSMRALKREKESAVRQRIQMVLLREDGKTQPEIAELTGVSLSTVNRAHMAYDHGGVNPLRPKPVFCQICQSCRRRGTSKRRRIEDRVREADWAPDEQQYDLQSSGAQSV